MTKIQIMSANLGTYNKKEVEETRKDRSCQSKGLTKWQLSFSPTLMLKHSERKSNPGGLFL